MTSTWSTSVSMIVVVRHFNHYGKSAQGLVWRHNVSSRHFPIKIQIRT